RVNTWAGRDSVRLVTATPPPEPDFSFFADLGAGDDILTLLVPPPDPDQPPPEPDFLPGLSVAVQGGAGNDIFQTIVGQRDMPLSATRPHLGFGLDLNYQAGMGDNTYAYEFHNVILDGHVDVNLGGSEGMDNANLDLSNVAANNGMA